MDITKRVDLEIKLGEDGVIRARRLFYSEVEDARTEARDPETGKIDTILLEKLIISKAITGWENLTAGASILAFPADLKLVVDSIYREAAIKIFTVATESYEEAKKALGN